MPGKQRQDPRELQAFLALPGALIAQPHLTSSLHRESLLPAPSTLQTHLRAAILPGAKRDFPSRRCRHLRGPPSAPPGPGAWPRGEESLSSREQGCPPAGERLGQSQFLCWALDGTDGREFQGSQPPVRSVAFQTRGPAGCPEEAAATGGAGSGTPQGIPSVRHCPAASPQHPVASSQRVGRPVPKLEGPARAVPCGCAPAHHNRLPASGTQRSCSWSSPVFGSNCIKKRGETVPRDRLSCSTVRLHLGHHPTG